MSKNKEKYYNILVINDDIIDNGEINSEYYDMISHIHSIAGNYYVITPTKELSNIYDFVENNRTMIVASSNTFKDLEINDFLMFIDETNSLPLFIIKDNKDFTHTMFLAVEERIPAALEYTINEEFKDLGLLKDFVSSYVNRKGNILDDKVIRTSDSGEEPTIKE